MQEVLCHSPRLYGLAHSRWWLEGIRQTIVWLGSLTLGGVHRLLRRLGLRYKRGRRHCHSPDPAYDEKLARLAWARALVAADPRRFVLVFEDELSYYRHPTVGYDYALAGSDRPHAHQGVGYNRYHRIAGSLDVHSGRLFCWQRRTFDRHTLLRYYRALEATYPEAEVIFVAQDNWPVHDHDDIHQGLAGSKIVLLPLPTYAPWTNPMEKVWRKLYQELLHLHDFTDRWAELRETVETFLSQFAHGSQELLRYTGLLTD